MLRVVIYDASASCRLMTNIIALDFLILIGIFYIIIEENTMQSSEKVINNNAPVADIFDSQRHTHRDPHYVECLPVREEQYGD